jgi:hypothetical protein
MAGTIAADTLTHSTAGSIATNYVVEGSAKAWINFDGTGTIASRDSLNVSSLSDGGTGIYSTVFTNAMNNDDYAMSGASGGNEGRMISPKGTYTTTTVQFYSNDHNGTAADNSIICINAHGDLA